MQARGGQLGSIPALVGLVVITVLFAVVHPGFLSAYNVEALVIQAAPIIVMAMGLVFVLLLGEIDLSAGTTGGLCSAIMAVLMLRHGVSWWLALVIGLIAGLLIGLGMGWLRARVGIPSLVITLGDVPGVPGRHTDPHRRPGFRDPAQQLAGDQSGEQFRALVAGVGRLLALLVVGYAAIKLHEALGRRRAGLSSAPFR